MRLWLSQFSNVKFMTKTLYSITLLISASLIPLSAQAINISAYRIYLDEETRNVSFIIFNREATYQDCNLSLRHNNFDADSKLTRVEDGIIPENSAKDWIRYSPREFVLTPSQSQTVRFTMRRKANAEDGEYRSYLVIDCGVVSAPNEQQKDQPQVSLQTKLVHNVPIIVRSGKLDATVWIDNIRAEGESLAFTLNRKGTRSVYGDVELINKQNGDVLSIQRNFSIYPESSRYHFTLGRDGVAPKDIKIRFTENKDFGGSIVLEKDAL
jgi:P pilus assembly chaperone PapD